MSNPFAALVSDEEEEENETIIEDESNLIIEKDEQSENIYENRQVYLQFLII